ncbi:MAG TPA: S16 family serine protease, partial [Flavobacterium sp.]|nr:S16 family serine protease [Flavobacterium sp.]
SAVTKRPVRKEVGLTGEITVRGRVLEIGGLKEKIIAASRAGVTEVIIPDDNRNSLDDVPVNIREKLKIHFVKNMDQVLPIALVSADHHDRTNPPASRFAAQI